MWPTNNEQLTKEQLEEILIKLTENSVLGNKPLNGNNSFCIIDTNPKKVAKVKSSIKYIDVKNENQESKELLDLIHQQHCIRLLQELVEKQSAINQASTRLKMETIKSFTK